MYTIPDPRLSTNQRPRNYLRQNDKMTKNQHIVRRCSTRSACKEFLFVIFRQLTAFFDHGLFLIVEN